MKSERSADKDLMFLKAWPLQRLTEDGKEISEICTFWISRAELLARSQTMMCGHSTAFLVSDPIGAGLANNYCSECRRIAEMVPIPVVRRAIADYMRSEGCDCCQDIEAHKKHAKILAELLGIDPYDDDSGYNFGKYESKERQ